MARATSVGIATAHACDSGIRARKIKAGKSIPPRAEIAGRIASLGFCRPSRISSPIKRKKMKVSTSESMREEYL
jgi:hypothetical protein